MRALLLSATAVLAAAAFSAPADAAPWPVCAGTAETIVVCTGVNSDGVPKVDPNGSSYDDCVYLGTPPCTPVSVPIPTVTKGSGLPVYASCGGRYGQNLCTSRNG